jgi:carbonic anhydrase/acetyltransferase-like protein (isoleucine patch superfamily)
MALLANRRVQGDWFDGVVPACVDVDPLAHLESAFTFIACRALRTHAVQIGKAAHIYSSSIFDVGPQGAVRIGEYAMLNGARLICESEIEIGAYAAISWNVVLMDSYRVALDPSVRRKLIEEAGHPAHALTDPSAPARPIRLKDNVWLGFDVCVLPGVTIGEGSVVGARSVVCNDVPPYAVVAGNPARPIRQLPRPLPSAPP